MTEAPPVVRLAVEAGEETEYYLAKRRSVVIRHSSDDRVVAFIEIVSPANKHSLERVHEFCEKVVTALKEGVHVLVMDLLPNTKAASERILIRDIIRFPINNRVPTSAQDLRSLGQVYLGR